MLILNVWAIPVGLVIGLAVYLLGHLWPPLAGDPQFGWVVASVTLVVGGISEFVGVKARLFFLPFWLIGLGALGFKLGFVGSVATVVLLIGGGIWWFKTAKKREAAAWEKHRRTPPALTPPASDEAAFWAWLKASLFLPIWSDYTPEFSDHNLPLVQTVR